MKKVVLSVLLLMSLTAFGQMRLSPTAQISIITCGPGQEEVYTAFGHSAIRVLDFANRIDYAYNYGVFDFNQPNFYINYTKGLLLFKLGVFSYPDFRDIYIYYDRSVTEQVLDLSFEQKQTIYNYLETNALPENETYRYDYFYNNCATKVRDVFAEVLKDSVHFDGSFITTQYTIRDLTEIYLKQQPWGDLGIDICLGLPMDKRLTPYEYMFLPDYIESSFDHATLKRGSTSSPLVKEKRIIHPRKRVALPLSWIHPWTIFGALLAISVGLSFYDLRRQRLSKWFDILIFGTTGVLGILLLLLWLATDHEAASKNMNLLWALPTNVVVLVITRRKSFPFLRKYFSSMALLTLILLLAWFILPQQMNHFLLPFVVALFCRAFVISRLL